LGQIVYPFSNSTVENPVGFEIRDNGFDYHVLVDAAQAIDNVSGLSCEIGLREGGGTKYIVDNLKGNRTHIAIDPYGELPYHNEVEQDIPHDYTNPMRNRTMVALYSAMTTKPNINFLFMPMEDTEFFMRFADGVPVYSHKQKTTINEYALVYFDGPHTTASTILETKFFLPRAAPGAVYVFDDVSGYYDHKIIADMMTGAGWQVRLNTPNKISYQNHFSYRHMLAPT
jgi:hypothetical protein